MLSTLPISNRVPAGSSFPAAVVSFVATAVAVYALADVYDAQRLMHLAVWMVLGLVLLPLAFAAGLLGCAGILLAVLGLLSLPAWLAGRRIGLGDVASGLWSLVSGILPGYWRALRGVRKPWLWAAAAGYVTGVGYRMLTVGL